MKLRPIKHPAIRTGAFAFIDLLIVLAVISVVATIIFALVTEYKKNKRLEKIQREETAKQESILQSTHPAPTKTP